MDKKAISYLDNILFLLADCYENFPEKAGEIVARSTKFAVESLYPSRHLDGGEEFCQLKWRRMWIHKFSTGFINELFRG